MNHREWPGWLGMVVFTEKPSVDRLPLKAEELVSAHHHNQNYWEGISSKIIWKDISMECVQYSLRDAQFSLKIPSFLETLPGNKSYQIILWEVFLR